MTDKIDFDKWKTSEELAKLFGYRTYRTVCDVARLKNVSKIADPRTRLRKFLYNVDEFKQHIGSTNPSAPSKDEDPDAEDKQKV